MESVSNTLTIPKIPSKKFKQLKVGLSLHQKVLSAKHRVSGKYFNAKVSLVDWSFCQGNSISIIHKRVWMISVKSSNACDLQISGKFFNFKTISVYVREGFDANSERHNRDGQFYDTKKGMESACGYKMKIFFDKNFVLSPQVVSFWFIFIASAQHIWQR